MVPDPFQSDFICFSHRCHFGATSISLRVDMNFGAISCRCHFDATSTSLLCHFETSQVTLRCHSTSRSLRRYFEFTYNTFRRHSDSTSMSLRLHFAVTATPPRNQIISILCPLNSVRSRFTSTLLRLHVSFDGSRFQSDFI